MLTSQVNLLLIAMVFMAISNLFNKKNKFISVITAAASFVVLTFVITVVSITFIAALAVGISAFITFADNNKGDYILFSVIFYIFAIIGIVISL